MEKTETCPNCGCNDVGCFHAGPFGNDFMRGMVCNQCSTKWRLRYQNPTVENVRKLDE